MKMKKMKAAMAAMAIVALTFTACSGDDGAAGPAGPAGNANVNSTNYEVLIGDWTLVGNAYVDTITVPSITSSIAENGVVQVFQRKDQSTTDMVSWRAVPYTSSVLSYSFSYTESQLILFCTATLANSVPTLGGLEGDHTYKVIVIPSTSLVEGVDINNYEEVKMVYGIEEYDVK